MFCLIIPRLILRHCLIATNNGSSLLMRRGRCLFAFLGSHEADKLKKFVIFCLPIPRLILRRCLVETHNNSQQNLERRPAGALNQASRELKRHQSSPSSGARYNSFPTRPHASKCLPFNGRPTLPARHEPKGTQFIASAILRSFPC